MRFFPPFTVAVTEYVLPKVCTPAETGDARAIVAVIAVTARTELNLREKAFIAISFFGAIETLKLIQR